jgi:hypothetical protein
VRYYLRVSMFIELLGTTLTLTLFTSNKSIGILQKLKKQT